MEPYIWGEHFWGMIFATVLAYPEKPAVTDKSEYKQYFTNLANILPCTKCRAHYRHFLETNNINLALQSKNHLIVYFTNLHNAIEHRKGRPPSAPTTLIKKYLPKYKLPPPPPPSAIYPGITSIISKFTSTASSPVPPKPPPPTMMRGISSPYTSTISLLNPLAAVKSRY